MRRERTEEECLRRVQSALRTNEARERALGYLAIALFAMGVLGWIVIGDRYASLISVGSLLCAVGCALRLSLAGWRDKSLAHAVSGLHDPAHLASVVPLLAHTYGPLTTWEAQRKAAEMLPISHGQAALEPADLATLQSVLRQLPAHTHPQAVMAVLGYFEAVGYVDALPDVASLDAPPRDPSIRAAASRCRDRLVHIQADAERSGALLRPADAPGGETLVRPAEPAPEEQLLRAVDGAHE